MSGIRAVSRRDISGETVVRQWDALSPHRAQQIREHKDISFWNLMVPTMRELLHGSDLRCVLDVGCGTGELTSIMSSECDAVVGVDISPVALSLARPLLAASQMTLMLADVAEIRTFHQQPVFTAAYANMVLMDVLDLDGVLKAISAVMLGRGAFVFSITHPVHWPQYRGYSMEPWFHYNEETFIQAPFRITEEQLSIESLHVHRPIARYTTALQNAGFKDISLFEPYPPRTGNVEYDGSWTKPRYLFGACLRRKRRDHALNAHAIRRTWHAGWLKSEKVHNGTR